MRYIYKERTPPPPPPPHLIKKKKKEEKKMRGEYMRKSPFANPNTPMTPGLLQYLYI